MYQVRDDVVLKVNTAPRPDPGAPLPAVVSDERHLLLAYIVEVPDPSWNGTYVNVVSPESPAEAIAIVGFQNAVCHLFGPPNDEAFAGHPLAARGLRPYTVTEVAKSSWIQGLERMNAVHPRHRPGYLDGCHHYIFAFHDSTFECVAEGFSVQRHRGESHGREAWRRCGLSRGTLCRERRKNEPGRALVRHEEETAMKPPPNHSLETPIWRLIGPFSDPGVLKLHEGRLALTIEDAGRPNLVAFYCTTALMALSVTLIALAPAGTRFLGLTSWQATWVALGLYMIVYAILVLKGSATAHTERLFDVPLDQVRDVVFPWLYLGGGVKLTVDATRYRIAFVRPTDATDTSGRLLARTGIAGGVLGLLTLGRIVRDLDDGLEVGKAWKAILTGQR